MRIKLPSAVLALKHRDIKPDRVHTVTQGTLNLWRFANAYVGELVIGDIHMTIDGAYINTVPPQEIADSIFAANQGDDPALKQWDSENVSAYMSELGSRTSEAKAAASRENGKRGGRPRKTK